MARLTLRQLLIAIALGLIFAALQGESPLVGPVATAQVCSEQPSGC